MIKNLLLLALIALAGVHGYIYMNYGTLDPCKAAAFRTINQPSSEAGRTLGQLVAGPIENRFRAKGTMTCYRAIFDENPHSFLQ